MFNILSHSVLLRVNTWTQLWQTMPLPTREYKVRALNVSFQISVPWNNYECCLFPCTGGARADLGRGCRGYTPSRDEAIFLLFAFKICSPHQSVMPLLSGSTPPKKILDPPLRRWPQQFASALLYCCGRYCERKVCTWDSQTSCPDLGLY